MEVVFKKYHGLGNDFIIIDNRELLQPVLVIAQCVAMCDRHFGIGADGVIFLLQGQNGCDFTMRVINSDGSETQMCGNGIRCLAKFLFDGTPAEARGSSAQEYSIWTGAGVIGTVVDVDGNVRVDMGEPILQPVLIPTLLRSGTSDSDPVIDVPLQFSIDGVQASVPVTTVSMGNQHAVTFVADLAHLTPSFSQAGPILARHSALPLGANIGFAQVLAQNSVRLQVWERGAGATLACGTGACAAVVAGVLSERLARECEVNLPGGKLTVHWDATNNRVYKTGPAIHVFTGSMTI